MNRSLNILLPAGLLCWFSSGTPPSPQFVLPASTTVINTTHPNRTEQTSQKLGQTLNLNGFSMLCNQAEITVEIRSDGWCLQGKDFIAWVDDAVNSVLSYYGKYPIKRTRIIIDQKEGRGIMGGLTSFDEDSQSGVIEIAMGKDTQPEDLTNTWTLTHEMVHLTFPLVNDQYNWLSEGIATYTEPLGRMRRGIISREQVWKDLVEGTPKGQPQAGDLGLNRTNTWGRTYWGGAIYCLLADIEIRKRSENRFGLEHALRGIMESGANAESDLLSAPEILTLGDLSTRNSVLTELYEAMKETPVTVDLSKIWQELGITVCGDSIKFDDNAPLANIRKAIENGHDRGELASR